MEPKWNMRKAIKMSTQESTEEIKLSEEEKAVLKLLEGKPMSASALAEALGCTKSRAALVLHGLSFCDLIAPIMPKVEDEQHFTKLVEDGLINYAMA
jgi:hypothetical protein